MLFGQSLQCAETLVQQCLRDNVCLFQAYIFYIPIRALHNFNMMPLLCSERCRTINGSLCAFPFWYGGQLHNTCTTMGTDGADKDQWCSTLTLDNSRHSHVSGNWGLCQQEQQHCLEKIKLTGCKFIMTSNILVSLLHS